MKTTCLHLQKGGVGKTTMSGSIAFELTKRGKTILVDVDPQGNSSSWLLKEAPKYELADVLQGRTELKDAIVQAGAISIIPSFGLDGELKTYGENKLADEPFIFCDLVDELAKLGYEYVIFDLSPGMGRLEKAALVASDEVISPIIPDEFSLDGIEIFANELKKLNKAFRKEVIHRKIIINGYDKRISIHKDVFNAAMEAKGFQKYVIVADPAFRKAQAAHVPVQELKGTDAAKPETLSELEKIAEGL